MNNAMNDADLSDASEAASGSEGGSAGPESAGELECLRKRVAELEGDLLRTAADFENSKKRIQKRSDELVKFGNERIILEILPLVDDLDRAITSLDEGSEPRKVLEGLHLAQNNFHRVLEQHGVETLTSVGQPFDPNFHEAVGEVRAPEGEEGSIAEEIQRGYLLNGRLVRPSRVKIVRN